MIASSAVSAQAALGEATRLINIVCLSAEVLAQEPLGPQAQSLADRVASAASEVADLLFILQSGAGAGSASVDDLAGVIRCGEIEIDTRGHRVHIGGKEVHLALADFSLLSVLVTHADTVVPHDVLQELAWGKRLPTVNALYAHVNRVRRALEGHPATLGRLQVVRGMGYRLTSR
jgi:DNA-binding response OmpR family regulator